MSYTPPSGSSADLKFGTGYSAPAGNAANLSFLTGYPASGFCSTQFGTPTEFHDLFEQASGIQSTQFGAPTISAQVTAAASGFCGTQYGAHSSSSAVSQVILREDFTGSGAIAGSAIDSGIPVATWDGNGTRSGGYLTEVGGDSDALLYPHDFGSLGSFVEVKFSVTSTLDMSGVTPTSIGGYQQILMWDFAKYDGTTWFEDFFGYVVWAIYERDAGGNLTTTTSGQHSMLFDVDDGLGNSARLCDVSDPAPTTPAEYLAAFIPLGETLNCRIRIENGDLTMYVNDVAVLTGSTGRTGPAFTLAPNYFEVYTQGFKVDFVEVSTGVAIASEIPVASGFKSTAFGTPTSSTQVSGQAAGFVLGNFGTPVGGAAFHPAGFLATQFGQGSVQPYAVGWQATRFGQVSIPILATGINAQIQLGAPSGSQYSPTWSIPPLTKFGWPTTTVNQTGEAYGFSSTAFGVPLKPISASVTVNLFCTASPISTTAFGAPVAQASQTAAASGTIGTNYGTPTLRLTQVASGATSTQLGMPVASARTRPIGFKVTTFGQPTQRRIQPASSTYRATRWGVPIAERSNTYKAYRINTPTRFGRPKGYSRFNYPTTAIHTTQLGIPTSFETHHAWRIEPTTHFGQPLLKRTPLC